jgi:hypothetical protein
MTNRKTQKEKIDVIKMKNAKAKEHAVFLVGVKESPNAWIFYAI